MRAQKWFCIDSACLSLDHHRGGVYFSLAISSLGKEQDVLNLTVSVSIHMEPLSITVSVLRITTTCVHAAKTLNEICIAWKRCPVTVSSLCSQLKLTGASLSQIQSLLLNDSDILKDRPDLVETFDTTLTSCLVLSTWLDKYMQSITKGVLDVSKATWKMKLKTLWNEDEVKELLQQLYTQQGAISVLVGLLQMDSMSEIRKLVRRHEALLRKIESNTRNLRRTHSIQAPESILGTDEASDSIFIKLVEEHDNRGRTLEESFESVVLNSNVYSKAFTGTLRPAPVDEADDAKTITDRSLDHTEAELAAKRLSNIKRPTVPIVSFATPGESFYIATRDLCITDISALSYMNYTAEHFGYLNLVAYKVISDIKKVDEHCYWGRTTTEGLLERRRVLIISSLDEPLLIRTTNASPPGQPVKQHQLTHDKEETIEIECIFHWAYWWASKNGEKGGAIFVDAIELDDHTRKNVDTILEFFSTSHPALTGLSEGLTLQDRIRILLRSHGGTKNSPELARIAAHCRSFADLQSFSRAYKEVDGDTVGH